MNLSGNRASLLALSRELSLHWQETRASWSDVRRDEFEHHYLDPLFAAVEKAAAALEQLDAITTQTRKDCE